MSYEDPVEQFLAILAVGWGLNLGDYDAYLESIASQPARDERLRWRSQALQAFREGNSSALEGWLTAMRMALLWGAREEHVLPKARQGARQSKTQAKRRTDAGVGNKRVADFHARLVKNGDYDATQQTATSLGLSPRQVRRIVSSTKPKRK